jgi:peroxiredoxin (alkyl hydroperoxide reductase subunit C)
MSHMGRPAPAFDSLPSTKSLARLDEPVSLSDYAGRWLVLLFYPADFGAVCPTEILAFSRHAAEFAGLGADVLAISTDGVDCHQAWIEFVLGRLNFPLASDATHSVSRDYGVLIEERGIAQRALFLIDPAGIVRYEVVHDLDTGRSVDEVLRVLQALTGPGSCAAGWQPGDRRLLGEPVAA